MATTKWAVDPTHSEVVFKIKHLMISTVTGRFNEFSATAETASPDDFNTASNIEFSANIASIDTKNEQRDAHLKSDDFFNAEKYPQLKFAGKKLTLNGSEGKLEGDLTIRETTKPLTLNVEYGGIVTDPYGQTKAGFTLTGKIKRKEFGLSWDAVTEAGNVVVSDEIKLQVEVQFVKQ
ncbi:MAG: polyisoprenoid-binding protein [Chitinophagaceae bacterium]|nr:MAG: polyisoprenoid-binding protein [Chitinophagaceae bacterium]